MQIKTTMRYHFMQSEWPSSKVVKTLPSNAGGGGLIPNPGAKIPPAWRSKHQNRNIIVTNSVKNVKNGPHPRRKILRRNGFFLFILSFLLPSVFYFSLSLFISCLFSIITIISKFFLTEGHLPLTSSLYLYPKAWLGFSKFS